MAVEVWGSRYLRWEDEQALFTRCVVVVWLGEQYTPFSLAQAHRLSLCRMHARYVSPECVR